MAGQLTAPKQSRAADALLTWIGIKTVSCLNVEDHFGWERSRASRVLREAVNLGKLRMVRSGSSSRRQLALYERVWSH